MKIHKLNTIVAVLYRPPDTRLGDLSGALTCLDETLAFLPSPLPSVVLCGGLNLRSEVVTWRREEEEGFLVPDVAEHRATETDGGKQDRLQAREILNLVEKYGMTQQVEHPTHGKETLDVVFTSDQNLVSHVDVNFFPTFTDHGVVTCDTTLTSGGEAGSRPRGYLCDTGRRYGALDFHKAPWPEIREGLAALDWAGFKEHAHENLTQALNQYRVLAVLEELVPEKKGFNRKPKMSKQRKYLWGRLNKVNLRLMHSTSVSTIGKLLKERRDLELKLRQSYTEENLKEENEAIPKIRKNPKVFFSLAKRRQKTKAKIGPFPESKTGKLNPDPAFSAKILKEQYESVFTKTRPAWEVKDPRTFFQTEGTGLLDNIAFSKKDIELACAELKANSAPGPDGVPASLLRECRKELSLPLAIFWRASMDSGEIPEELLLVQICPQHKGGSRTDPAQFRPVALTSHQIKVFERVVRRAVATHLDTLGVLPDNQHGSRSGRSTLTQLLAHWDSVLDDLEAGEGCDTIYLDFSKAYDKCETGVMLHKMKSAKITGKVGIWMAAFLNPNIRKQAVMVEGALSPLSLVLSGVPQGTVMAPVIFLLMIADIARGVSSPPHTLLTPEQSQDSEEPENCVREQEGSYSRVSSFVDDTRVNKMIKDHNVDCPALQRDLESIYRWAEDVGLLFNTKKFECLRYWPGGSKPDQPYLSPEGTPIEEKYHLRDLGVQMSTDLTFKIQINNVITGASKMSGWVQRTFKSRSKLVMKTCWNSMVQSKLDYCSQLWSPTDQATISRLEDIARHYTSRIWGMKDLDYLERLQALQMLSQERRRERYMVTFIWKISMGMVKGYHGIKFKYSQRRGWEAVPCPIKAGAPVAVRRAREASLAHRGVAIFNLLPRGLRDMASDHQDRFKSNLDVWLSEIPDQPTVPGRQRAAETNSLLHQVPMMVAQQQ